MAEPINFSHRSVLLEECIEALNIKEIYEHEKALTEYLVEELSKLENVTLFVPHNKDKHIAIVSFGVAGYKSDDIGLILDEDYGIAVRTGYHCAPHIHAHLKDTASLGTVRVGLGRYSTYEEIDKLVDALAELVD